MPSLRSERCGALGRNPTNAWPPVIHSIQYREPQPWRSLVWRREGCRMVKEHLTDGGEGVRKGHRRPLHAKRPCRTVSGAFPVIYNSQEGYSCSCGYSESNIRYMRDVVIASLFTCRCASHTRSRNIQ